MSKSHAGDSCTEYVSDCGTMTPTEAPECPPQVPVTIGCKDVPAPRGGLTDSSEKKDHILFSDDVRAEIKAKNPDWDIANISKEIERNFPNAAEDVCKYYRKKAEENQKKYNDKIFNIQC